MKRNLANSEKVVESTHCKVGLVFMAIGGPDELVGLVVGENCCLLLGRLSRNVGIFEYGIKLKLLCLSNEDDLFNTINVHVSWSIMAVL